MSGPRSPRVVATTQAVEALRRLVGERGPVVIVLSDGCCDGGTPLVLDAGDLSLGEHDVHLGDVEGCHVYGGVGRPSVNEGTEFVLGVDAGEPEGFSLPAGPDAHFTITARRVDVDA